MKPSKRTRSAQASRKPAPPVPLTASERSNLFDLIDEAAASNHNLLEYGRYLEEARTACATAQENLRTAEIRMAEERVRNRNIHAAAAPLLQRLPTV